MRILLALVVGSGVAMAQEPLDIAKDTTLDPAKTYGAIVVKTPGITIDGRGAWIVGATEGSPKDYKGTGISAAGVSKVTIRNVNVKGFETGLRVEDAEGWTVEGCNFSDNFHDPAFGWGENGRRGGIVLTRVRGSSFRKNRANNVWDGCSLDECDGNAFEENDFSHCSNTCLKLWTSCRNTVVKNVLSHGIRIDPGEVHARDSTSVLIESGSNDNLFRGNDCTHGGDGIFVRVLNGWCSTGNLFEENDASYANNNAVECWAPRNRWVRNKANHSSYGFWMGGSDQTVLIGNEAAHNGDPKGHHNSPHLPDGGHAGIVFMFGPGSHVLLRGNRCHHNNGAGIALIGDQESAGKKWKILHWVVEQNELSDNRWDIYAQHADWVRLAANDCRSAKPFEDAGGVTNLFQPRADPAVKAPPVAKIAAPATLRAGKPAVLDALQSADPEGRKLGFRWDLGDGAVATEGKVTHTWKAPGFYRVGLTVDNGALADLAWLDAYVVEDVEELGTEGGAAAWGFVCQTNTSKIAFADDPEVRISGKSSLRAHISPYGGFRVAPLYPASKDAKWSLRGKKELVFWARYFNGDVTGWQEGNPVVTLHETEDRFIRLVPSQDWFRAPKYNEGRDGWNYYAIPLAGDEAFRREGAKDLKTIHWISIGVDSWGAPPLRIWIDGLALK